MARLRLSLPAQADLAHILVTSAERWGSEARRRYAGVLAAALRKVANDPASPLARERPELAHGIHSLHIRHVRDASSKVLAPVHVIYYRAVETGLTEILRVLHEHMEPSRHLGGETVE